MDKIQSVSIPFRGGLDSNKNHIELSSQKPGYATQLVNFEPSLYGGYRRIEGFEKYDETYDIVDEAGAQGKILGIIIFDDEIYAARRNVSAPTTYKLYKYANPGGWSAVSPGFTLNYTSGGNTVNRLRYETFNFGDGDKLIIVDGVNYAYMYDGSSWIQIESGNTGANYANAGGAQVVDAPKYVSVYKNHIFLSGDSSAPGVISHSAPSAEYDWTSASGAGQIIAGFSVVQTKPWRDNLFVFGKKYIKRITVESTDFVTKDVTQNIGCVAEDSVLEIGSDLIYLAQDGVRTVSGTANIGDVRLETISKNVQDDVKQLSVSLDLGLVVGVVIRNKSQFRYFFADSESDNSINKGLLGALVAAPETGIQWEWSTLLGFEVSAATVGYINNMEVILHGDFDGFVYKQESGNSLNGSPIGAIFSTPYLDFNSPTMQKNAKELFLFVKPEGAVEINAKLTYDWGDRFIFDPISYGLEDYQNTEDVVYDGTSIVYGTTYTYGSQKFPLLRTNTQGQFQSVRFSFSSVDTNPPYSIQALVLDIYPRGHR